MNSSNIFKIDSNQGFSATSNSTNTLTVDNSGSFNGLGSAGNYIPSYPINYFYSYPNQEPTYAIKLEKVENGWVVHKNGQKFVITKPEQILKYLTEESK